MLIDSHCHLDHYTAEELPSLITRAMQADLEGLLTIGTRFSHAQTQIDLAYTNQDKSKTLKIWASIGTHPDYVVEEGLKENTALISLTDDPVIIGIGETGLDYFHGKPEVRDLQKENFLHHISASRKTGLPLIIHSRNADEDMAAILSEETEKGAFPFLLHCFSSGEALAKTALALGGYVSFSGILTFRKSEELREIARNVPFDRLLVETDAPYLAPIPFRGKKNEPSYVVHTAKTLADIHEMSLEQLCDTTTQNFYRLFSKAGAVT